MYVKVTFFRLKCKKYIYLLISKYPNIYLFLLRKNVRYINFNFKLFILILSCVLSINMTTQY